mgnify:CR=1 FL=1
MKLALLLVMLAMSSVTLSACADPAPMTRVDAAREAALTFCVRLGECAFVLDVPRCTQDVVQQMCFDGCAGDVEFAERLDACLDDLAAGTCTAYAHGWRPNSCLGVP